MEDFNEVHEGNNPDHSAWDFIGGMFGWPAADGVSVGLCPRFVFDQGEVSRMIDLCNGDRGNDSLSIGEHTMGNSLSTCQSVS